MEPHPERVATVVLVGADGEPLGALPPFPVDMPWWDAVAPLVRIARDRHGIEVTVLRLLEASGPYPGGPVTYLAETADRPRSLRPWNGTLDDHPLRQTWARPGGPAADIAWATDRLAARGLPLVAPPEQMRSWNLSSIWRLPVRGQRTWLKVVPPFFAQEGQLIGKLRERAVPQLLASDGPRIVLAEIPGQDLYDAPLPRLLEMVTLLVELQGDWIGRTDELLEAGLPDWRPDPLTLRIADTVKRTQTELPPSDVEVLMRFVAELPGRFAATAECGLPDTVVHGDVHPGNFRGDETHLVLLDWGDAGVGHPLLDEPAFLERTTADTTAIRAHWHAAWRQLVPGSDPERAAALLAPVAAARQAVIYRGFLDRIEPSEYPYHRDDPRRWLERTASLIRADPEYATL